MKPSFSREIVPNEKSFFFIDMKGITNKENINNKNLIISKIIKKKTKQNKQFCGAEVCNYNESSHKQTHPGWKHSAISRGCWSVMGCVCE